ARPAQDHHDSASLRRVGRHARAQGAIAISRTGAILMSGTQWFDSGAGQDQSQALLERVREAISRAEPLRIVGGGSKSFLGRPMDDALPVLDISGHRGIVSYDPT